MICRPFCVAQSPCSAINRTTARGIGRDALVPSGSSPNESPSSTDCGSDAASTSAACASSPSSWNGVQREVVQGVDDEPAPRGARRAARRRRARSSR
jgi:hypothetical protein